MAPSVYTVYVLYSAQFDKLYIGMTTDLPGRMISHNALGHGYTARYRPWQVLHTETFTHKSESLKREKALKGGQGRSWIRSTFL
jgi:putative endonuclease